MVAVPEAAAAFACSRAILRLSLNERAPGERLPSSGDPPAAGDEEGESEGEVPGGMAEVAEANFMCWE